MLGCDHILQNSFISLLIKLVLSSSSIIFALILSIVFNNVEWATFSECVNEFLNFFNIMKCCDVLTQNLCWHKIAAMLFLENMLAKSGQTKTLFWKQCSLMTTAAPPRAPPERGVLKAGCCCMSKFFWQTNCFGNQTERKPIVFLGGGPPNRLKSRRVEGSNI